MSKHLPYDRTERLADMIYQVIAEAMKTKMVDPRLEGVEITRVNVTRDLRTARICFHFAGEHGDDRRINALKGFKSARGFLKRCIGEEIPMKFMPEIEFFYDEGVDTRDRIDELFEKIHTQKSEV